MGLDGIRWHASARGIHAPEVVLRAGVALFSGAAVPRDGPGGILRHASALSVHAPKVVLRAGVALLGGAAVPRDRFGGILRHASAGVARRRGVHSAPRLRTALRGVALLGGAAVPRDRFGDIRWYADAGDMNAAEDELRLGVARLGAGAEVCEGLCGWPVFILCLNTGRTAHREDEGGDHESAAHKVATHCVYSKSLADRYSTRRFAAGP